MADTGKIKFTDPRLAIEDEITKLYAKGVYFIIALGSAGYDGGMSLLEQIFNVDMFISGGSNTFLFNGKFHSQMLLFILKLFECEWPLQETPHWVKLSKVPTRK